MKNEQGEAALGLSRKQKRVLNVLVHGPSTPLTIAKETRISRTSIYDILHNLKKRGLVRSRITNEKKRWELVPPQQIEEICTDIKRYLIRTPSGTSEITTHSAQVIAHHGHESARHAIHEMFKRSAKKRMRALQGDAAEAGWKKLFSSNELNQLNITAKATDIISEAIMPEGWIKKHALQLGLEWIQSQNGRIRRTNEVHPRYFNHGGQFIVIDDAVYLLSLKETLVIEIRNTEIRKMLTILFEFMQDNSTPINSNALYRDLLEQALAKDASS